MRRIIRKCVVLFSIIVFFCSSVLLVSGADNKLTKSDFLDDSSIYSPNWYIEKQRENGEGGEDRNTPFNKLENDFQDKEEESNNLMVILGNQVKRDGSNGLEIHPAYILLAITSLLTIIMVCTIRKK
jgi:hypothetical protein